VCGLYERSEDAHVTGAPPTWLSYVSVDDAEAVVVRAEELGGRLVDDVVDVIDAGRMAVLADPQGAVFALWQPHARTGAQRVNDVGCLCMNELVTTDMEASRVFYDRLFGWALEVSGGAPDGPYMVLNRGHINAAFFPAPDGTSAHWRTCFTVASTQEAVDRVRELGGQQLLAPVDIGHGSIAMVRDPQGVIFTMFAGETDP
jgi:hypothetical protein